MARRKKQAEPVEAVEALESEPVAEAAEAPKPAAKGGATVINKRPNPQAVLKHIVKPGESITLNADEMANARVQRALELGDLEKA